VEAYCSYSLGSYTYPTSNHTVLGGFEFPHVLEELMSLEVRPDLLLPLVHELTHRVCFRSRVGSALALLSLHVRRHLLGNAMDGESNPSPDVADRAKRYVAVLEYLRPIAEGIAMFAELHVTPGEARAGAEPIIVANALFAGKSLASGDGDWALSRLLAQQRVATRGTRTRLLSETPSANSGGYLLGYLSMRRCWMQAARRAPLFHDRSLFLAFLVERFFGDPLLTEKLLVPGSAPALIDWVDARVRMLLDSFSGTGLAATAEAFEAALVKNASFIPSGSDGGQAAVARARALIASEWSSLQDVPATSQELLGLLDIETLVQRELIWLASTVVAVSDGGTSATVRIEIGAHVSIEIPRLGRSGPGPAELDVFVVPSPFCVVVAVHRGGDVVALQPIVGKLDDDLRRRYLSTLQGRTHVVAAEAVMHQYVRSAMDGAEFAQMIADAKRRCAETLTTFWLRAFPRMQPDRVAAFRRGGLPAVMGNDLEDLSLLSLAHGCTTSAVWLRRMFEGLGKNFDQCVARVGRAGQAQFGNPLALVAADEFFCFL
jgi:hypothetical protein